MTTWRGPTPCACADCGSTRRQLHADPTGDLICFACFQRRPSPDLPSRPVFVRWLRREVAYDPRALESLLRAPRPKPPPVEKHELVLRNLEAHGLPVEYIGNPGSAGSLCPMCAAGMQVRWTAYGVTFDCAAGCDEAQIVEVLR